MIKINATSFLQPNFRGISQRAIKQAHKDIAETQRPNSYAHTKLLNQIEIAQSIDKFEITTNEPDFNSEFPYILLDNETGVELGSYPRLKYAVDAMQLFDKATSDDASMEEKASCAIELEAHNSRLNEAFKYDEDKIDMYNMRILERIFDTEA